MVSYTPFKPNCNSYLPSMRIYPHLQDTGGFFVAVLERNPDAVVNKK